MATPIIESSMESRSWSSRSCCLRRKGAIFAFTMEAPFTGSAGTSAFAGGLVKLCTFAGNLAAGVAIGFAAGLDSVFAVFTAASLLPEPAGAGFGLGRISCNCFVSA